MSRDRIVAYIYIYISGKSSNEVSLVFVALCWTLSRSKMSMQLMRLGLQIGEQ